jgi:hypothetical protein
VENHPSHLGGNEYVVWDTPNLSPYQRGSDYDVSCLVILPKKEKNMEVDEPELTMMDKRVLERLKPPFSYETLDEPMGIRYRIRDSNDDALGSTYNYVYAKLIVSALNENKKMREAIEAALPELENAVKPEGAGVNWPLVEAIKKVKEALGP